MINRILNKIKRFKEIKFRFDLPPKKKIIQYDELNSKILKIMIKKDFNIIPRHEPVVYFWIFLKQIIFFDFKFKTYFKNYIKFTSAKIVINMIDNDLSFYTLKDVAKNINFISIQNGIRKKNSYMFKNKTKNKLKCDHIFVMNEYYKKEYSKVIQSNYHILGNYKNNMVKINRTKYRNTFLFLSQYKKYLFQENYILDFFESVSLYFSKSKKKINILLKSKDSSGQNDEIEFYKKFFKSNCIFHKCTSWNESYKTVDKFENIIFMDTTLGSEAISRKKKVAIFSRKKNRYVKEYFGWPDVIKKKYNFFLAKEMSYNEIKRVLDNIFYCTQIDWEKNYYKIIKNQIHIDYNNHKLNRVISDILKKPDLN